MKDFYYILGTGSDANPEEIDAAYQKLALKFYDDEDAFMDAHFREIAEAYDVLRDTARRRKYDAALKQDQHRRLSAFRIRYLNLAVAITFLALTALFAAYVVETLHGRAVKKQPPKAIVQPAAVQAASHTKKHHKLTTTPVAAKLPVNRETVILKKPMSEPMPAVLPPIKADTPGKVTLHANITGIVYLHRSPDYNSDVLAKIADGTQVRLLGKGQGWCKVGYQGLEGYVMKSSVEGK
ncbi:MAG TPA: DnaJ domain-containing protein [Mucilaginibacter sp.]|nr:DnaJ domain-containing protein [Mucilaginibacter sp.]